MALISRRVRRKLLLVGMNLAVQVAGTGAGVLLHGSDGPAPTAAPAGGQHPALTGSACRRPAPERRPVGRNDPVSRGLESASRGLGLARLQLRAGLTQDAQETLGALHEQLQSLRRQVEPSPRRGTPTPRRAAVAAR
jgi:hypothetical protein